MILTVILPVVIASFPLMKLLLTLPTFSVVIVDSSLIVASCHALSRCLASLPLGIGDRRFWQQTFAFFQHCGTCFYLVVTNKLPSIQNGIFILITCLLNSKYNFKNVNVDMSMDLNKYLSNHLSMLIFDDLYLGVPFCEPNTLTDSMGS